LVGRFIAGLELGAFSHGVTSLILLWSRSKKMMYLRMGTKSEHEFAISLEIACKICYIEMVRVFIKLYILAPCSRTDGSRIVQKEVTRHAQV
jgi:hypothetical protein